VPQIVANILLFQRANGGWPKDYDMLAVLTDEQRKVVVATHDRADTSFDNHNVHPQVDYLARAYTAGGEESWRQACLRGLDFMLAAQLANGGFPQSYPKAKGFAADITFNDGVTIGVLSVLEDISEGLPHWTWLDKARRQRARDAVARGIECILKCQIRVGDRLTGWCQQHDPVTFLAAPARTFELASICPQDSTEVVQFLMRFPKPSARIVASIDAAVEWLSEVPLSGTRIEKGSGPRGSLPTTHSRFRCRGHRRSEGPADLGPALRNRNKPANFCRSRRDQTLCPGRHCAGATNWHSLVRPLAVTTD
jgi:PelA/Pel-15E family pectate lyase